MPPSHRGSRPVKALVATTLALVIGVLAGCTTTTTGSSSSSSSAAEEGNIAFLLPDTVLARWEQQDRPTFIAAAEEACPDCTVSAYNARGSTADQQDQAETALTNGAKVLVITAVDTKAAVSIVRKAEQQGVDVISYGRIIADEAVDYGVTTDPAKIGAMQAQSLVDTLAANGVTSGGLVMLNGSPTDSAAPRYKAGAHSVLDQSPYEIVAEYDTQNWDPGTAQQHMEQAITKVGNDGFVGVYAGNDGLAAGAIAAMKGAGIDPSTRPTTGQDSELAAVQRIIAGEQLNTIYQPILDFSAKAAELAVALSRGEEPPEGLINGTTPTEIGDIPAYIYENVVITKDNVGLLVEDGFLTVEQICTEEYADACAEAGLT